MLKMGEADFGVTWNFLSRRMVGESIAKIQ